MVERDRPPPVLALVAGRLRECKEIVQPVLAVRARKTDPQATNGGVRVIQYQGVPQADHLFAGFILVLVVLAQKAMDPSPVGRAGAGQPKLECQQRAQEGILNELVSTPPSAPPAAD